MSWQKTKLLLLLSATAGITVSLAYAVYILTQQKDEEDEPKLRVKTSRNVTIEVRVPKESIGIVIGRGGSTIKSIQQKSETRINFKDDENQEYRTCIIRGTPETAQLAESMILEVIKNQPLVETEEIWVPKSAIGIIIGKGGENIKAMSSMSLAKISVASSANYDTNPESKIKIQGTFEQIELAKTLIAEKVAAEAEQRQKISQNAAHRSPRNKPKHLELTNSPANTEQQNTGPLREKLISTNSDGFMQVYVSAVCNPSLFWVQMITRKSVDLDRLVDEMTEFYNVEENRASQAVDLKTLEVGLQVASRFSMDKKWYRAEIVEIVQDEYNPEDSKIEVFYVDYGNSDNHSIKDLCLLKPEFLRLTFQAIACCLDNVQPKDADTWSEEATDCFEALTYACQWKPLMARVNCYTEPSEKMTNAMPMPCIDLVDTSSKDEDIRVGLELIKQGFAVRVRPEPSDNPEIPVNSSSSLPNSNDISRNSTNRQSRGPAPQERPVIKACPAGYEDELAEDEDDFDFY
ncbi:unnamed protein product [Bemisia tabaci]|uniref:Tudor domain-containing protein n=1 Tax=Bemisia tabaci TaxID=7038 RepID=A0A9P0AC26_BEMTA|nr:unnamed protein product [Bemisia tabaci]